MGRNWARLGGENSRSKGCWGRWQANGCFRRCQAEGFCAGGIVARQTAPACTRYVRTEKASARTKPAWGESPRTGVYVISPWNVRGTGRTGCNRAQGSFFTDVEWDDVKRELGSALQSWRQEAEPAGPTSEAGLEQVEARVVEDVRTRRTGQAGGQGGGGERN